MKTIVLINNKDIKISVEMMGDTPLLTSCTPKKSIDEWTSAYEKRCDHWKAVAKQMKQSL